MQACHMVFMRMAHEDDFGGVEFRAYVVGHDGGVKSGSGVRALDQNLIAIGVFAASLAEENSDPAKVGAGNARVRGGHGSACVGG